MKILSLLALALVAASTVCVSARAAMPHDHGWARLDVAVEPHRVTLDLLVPLDSLLGFERAPRNDVERQRADAAVARLRAAGELFRINGAAGCTPAQVTLVAPALGLGAGLSVKAGGKEAHADIDGHFEFTCKAGARAGQIEVGLFGAFAGLRRIELQVVTPKGQMKATLLRPASRVALVR